ncbi:MAG: hypothetical protein SGI88_00895 [Candidatus Hydrogenedentes bacterium]|nr:hypothetical protein [Candidatus Hydrogenedentota bacterium]
MNTRAPNLVKILRFYLLVFRKSAGWLLWPAIIYVELGRSLSFGETTGSGLEQVPILVSTVAIIFGAFFVLVGCAVHLRSEWMHVIYTLPIERNQIGTLGWLFYVLTVPIAQTVLIYAGSHREEPHSWADENILFYGVTCLAFHATLFSAATVSRDLGSRLAFVIAVMAFATVPVLVDAVFFPGMPITISWSVIALVISFFRKSQLTNFDPISRELSVEPSIHGISVSAEEFLHKDVIRKSVEPPPLPAALRTQSKSVLKHPVEANPQSLSRIPMPLRKRFLRVCTLGCMFGLAMAICLMPNWSGPNPRTDFTNPSAWAIAVACASSIVAIMLERRRFNIYRILPMPAHGRCLYALLVAIAPAVLMFVITTPLTILAFDLNIKGHALGMLLAVGIAISMLSMAIVTITEAKPHISAIALNIELPFLQFGLFSLFVVMTFLEPLFQRLTVYATPVVLLVGCAHFFFYQYRQRGV